MLQFITLDKYILKKFGDTKLSYPEYVIKVKLYTRTYKTIRARMVYQLELKNNALKNEAIKEFKTYLYACFNEADRSYLKLFDLSLNDKILLLDKGDLLEKSSGKILRYMERKSVSKELLKDFLRAINISSEEFLYKCLAQEVGFLYDYNIFGKQINRLKLLLEIEENTRDASRFMSDCNKGRITSRPIASKHIQIKVIQETIHGTFALTRSVKTIEQLIAHSDVPYDLIKKLIFSNTRNLTNVVAGDVTRESYNIDGEIKSFLTAEDFKLLENVIFIGNNSIHIGF